jgi:signal transduction histidine kinase
MTACVAVAPQAAWTLTAAGRVERVLVWAVGFFRVGGLVQIWIAVALTATASAAWWPYTVLAAAVTAESAALVTANFRRGALHPGWLTADAVFCAVGLPTGAALAAPGYGHSWAFFMYPFTLITSLGIGMTYRRPATVAAMTAVLAGAYCAAAMTILRDPAWNVTPNTVSYFANTTVAWAVARQLRGTALDADDSNARAITQADELARERERARHARMLHDRVLQTLETLARSDWVGDTDMRAHIATEAAWLRALVEGVPVDEPDDLLTALQAVVERQTHTGLRIEFNSTQLKDAMRARVGLPGRTVEALADATHEALTNVAKHAGVDTATVRATVADQEIVISVLDHGCGFDPATAHRGIGLDTSIHRRMNEVGGAARIDSAPGGGTYLELVMPIPDA